MAGFFAAATTLRARPDSALRGPHTFADRRVKVWIYKGEGADNQPGQERGAACRRWGRAPSRGPRGAAGARGAAGRAPETAGRRAEEGWG